MGDAAAPGRCAGLAAGLAAGTKLNFLLPAAVLVLGLVADRPARAAAGGRSRVGRPGGAGRRRLLVPAQPRPHRQPAALGPPPRPDLAARARPGPRRPRSPQRPRLPQRRLGLVGLVPPRPPPRPLAPLAAARRSLPSPASCSRLASLRRRDSPPTGRRIRATRRRGIGPSASVLRAGRAGRAGGGARLARRADLGLGPRRDAARLRIRPPLPRPGPGPRPRPAASRPGSCAARLAGPAGAVVICLPDGERK